MMESINVFIDDADTNTLTTDDKDEPLSTSFPIEGQNDEKSDIEKV